MPIILNDEAIDTENLVTVAKKMKPNAKYFSQSLTGTGSKSGLLSETNLPIGVLPQDFHVDLHDIYKASKYKTQIELLQDSPLLLLFRPLLKIIRSL